MRNHKEIFRIIMIVSLCWIMISFIFLLTYYLDIKFNLASKTENENQPPLFATNIKIETQIEKPEMTEH